MTKQFFLQKAKALILIMQEGFIQKRLTLLKNSYPALSHVCLARSSLLYFSKCIVIKQLKNNIGYLVGEL